MRVRWRLTERSDPDIGLLLVLTGATKHSEDGYGAPSGAQDWIYSKHVRKRRR